MKRTHILTVTALAASLLASCDKPKTTDASGDKPAQKEAAPATPMEKAEALMTKLSGGLETAVVALESITDKATAEAAAAKIKTVSAELSALAPQAQALKTSLSEEDAKAMETMSMEKMKPLMGRMTEAMQKVMTNPETGDILMPVMDEFRKAMAPPRAQ